MERDSKPCYISVEDVIGASMIAALDRQRIAIATAYDEFDERARGVLPSGVNPQLVANATFAFGLGSSQLIHHDTETQLLAAHYHICTTSSELIAAIQGKDHPTTFLSLKIGASAYGGINVCELRHAYPDGMEIAQYNLVNQGQMRRLERRNQMGLPTDPVLDFRNGLYLISQTVEALSNLPIEYMSHELIQTEKNDVNPPFWRVWQEYWKLWREERNMNVGPY